MNYRKCVTTIIFLLFTILFNSCGTEPDEKENYHNKILFASRRGGDGKEQLYMMNPDGTNIKQITSGEHSHGRGKWSPDTKKIVANTTEGWNTASPHMIIINSNGTGRKFLNTLGSQMKWHPNGQQIFYTFCPSCEIGIFNLQQYIMNSDGTNPKAISNRFVGELDLHSNGKRAILGHEENRKSRLILVDYPSFTNPKLIGPSNVSIGSWAPNMKNIVFSYSPSDTDKYYTIAMIDSSGENFKILVENNTNTHYYNPRWSPDGKKIVFQSTFTDGSAKTYINILDIETKEVKRIIDDPTANSPDWSW